MGLCVGSSRSARLGQFYNCSSSDPISTGSIRHAHPHLCSCPLSPRTRQHTLCSSQDHLLNRSPCRHGHTLCVEQILSIALDTFQVQANYVELNSVCVCVCVCVRGLCEDRARVCESSPQSTQETHSHTLHSLCHCST